MTHRYERWVSLQTRASPHPPAPHLPMLALLPCVQYPSWYYAHSVVEISLPRALSITGSMFKWIVFSWQILSTPACPSSNTLFWLISKLTATSLNNFFKEDPWVRILRVPSCVARYMVVDFCWNLSQTDEIVLSYNFPWKFQMALHYILALKIDYQRQRPI